MNYIHLSGGSDGEHVPQEWEFDRKRKLASHINRRNFIRSCLEEEVLPRSAPVQLYSDNHPFTASARKYLEEVYKNLSNEICKLSDVGNVINLPHHMIDKLRVLDHTQKEKLKRKLMTLCNNSKWNTAGRQELITNLSNKRLTPTEKAALSLGLKFDIGVDKKSYIEHVTNNYRGSDSDIEKGFSQGVIACCKAMADSKPKTIPKRYETALHDLSKNKDIVREVKG